MESQSETNKQALVVFLLNGQRFALPLACVKRILRVVAITTLPEAPPLVLGIIDLGGVVIPVINIRKRFNYPPQAVKLSDQLIIAGTGSRIVALLVDDTPGVIEVGPENYAGADEITPNLEIISGAVKLEDGLILIHDLDQLLSPEEKKAIDYLLNKEELRK